MIIICFFSFCFSSVYAIEKTAEKEYLYFVGLDKNQWKVFIKPLKASKFQIIETKEEPRGIYFNAEKQQLIYIGSSGNLRQFKLEKNKDEIILQLENKQGYAQPFMDNKSGEIYMMFMPEGKSSQSDIAVWNNGKIKTVIKQLSSQFEPVIYKKWLYYGQLQCRIDCGHLIREIWRKNLISGESEQITLMGRIARQHIIDPHGKWIYFSSNQTGHYLLWRYSLSERKLEQLTKGAVHDSFPAVDSTGNVYFVRRKADQAVLLRLNNTMEQLLTIPEGVSDIRNLRINH
jgi:hypothetical protein